MCFISQFAMPIVMPMMIHPITPPVIVTAITFGSIRRAIWYTTKRKKTLTPIVVKSVKRRCSGNVAIFRIGRRKKFINVNKLPRMTYAPAPPKIVMYCGR